MTRQYDLLRALVCSCLFCIPASLVLNGCGGSTIVNRTPAPTLTITATPQTISAGGSVTLIVTAVNATAVAVSGSDGSSYTYAASGGSKSITPSATTNYTATATGTGGETTAATTVTVTPVVNPAPTVTISASPTSVPSGTPTTLTVAATNATAVTISGSDSSSYTLAASGGTKQVTPASTTTYTATATGGAGTTPATDVVEVTVTAPPPPAAPTVTILAAQNPIAAGSSTFLNVVASNATQVVVTANDGSGPSALSATGGQLPVSPAATTIYTATATGAGGTQSAIQTLKVTPTVTITAKPMSVPSGSGSSLSFSAVDATQVTIAGNDGTTYPQQGASGGIQPVFPTNTTTYTATATNADGIGSSSVTVTVTPVPTPTVTLSANPATIVTGNPSQLTVEVSNATQATLSGSDGTLQTFPFSDAPDEKQTWQVSPTVTTIYTATATGPGGTSPDSIATVTVKPPGSVASIGHVIFLMQENRSFDNYFGMLNPYRKLHGWDKGDDGTPYVVDGIDDKRSKIVNQDREGNSYSLFKFKSTCIDDQSSDWLASFGDVNRYDFTADRKILMDGFVHNAEGYETSCKAGGGGTCSGQFTEQNGKSAMGYYDETFLNYYYYMASQYAISDRWFSPMAAKSVDNRIATFTGGTTHGLVKDPGGDDHLQSTPVINNIFQELDQQGVGVTWKIYFTVTQGFCLSEDACTSGGSNAAYPATYFSNLSYSYKFLQSKNGPCPTGLSPSINLGDPGNTFCYDPNHIAHYKSFLTDLANNTLPSFAFIEAGYGANDEHPGSPNDILLGQAQVALLVNAFMLSPSYSDSVFFLSYDEAGGPYDHVPPVPGHSNDFTDPSMLPIPDIASIAVAPDGFPPCTPPVLGVPTINCDLKASDPGALPGQAAYYDQQGFGAQIGFRVPNIVISPFVKRHYVSHVPMDHTAIIKFVENRFIGPKAYLTARDKAQPDLMDFFDFNGVPWAIPPTPPAPVTATTLGYNPCTAGNVGP